MTRREFFAAYNALRFIDCWELVKAGVFANDQERDDLWPHFLRDPHLTLLQRMSESQAEKVWSIVERRMLPPGPASMKVLGDVILGKTENA